MAEPGLLDSLTHPAFPPAIDARDRHFGWFCLTVVVGFFSAIVFAFLFALIGVIVTAVVLIASGHGGDIQAVMRQITTLLTSGHDPTNLQQTATALIVLAALNTPTFVLPVMLAALLGRRSFRLYLTQAKRFRWRLLLSGMVLMSLSLLPIFIIGEIIEPTSTGIPLLTQATDLPGRLAFVAIAFACLIPAAAAEEILFRGWLLRQSMAFLRNPWVAMAINGVLFAAMHLNPNLDDSFQLAMMGVAFCYMAFRFGGIEFSIGAHAINNILIVIFFQSIPLASPPHHPFSLMTALGGFLVPAACIATTELIMRWPRLRRLVGAEPPQPVVAVEEAFV